MSEPMTGGPKTDIVECDILVIGGGTGGPMAAIKAKERNPGLKVVLMEKANVKRSGAVSMGMDGLNNAVIPGYATPEQYVKEITVANDGIVHQKAVMAYAQGSYPMIQYLDSIGVKFEKDGSGEYNVRKVHHMGTYVLPMPEGHHVKKALYRQLRRLQVMITNRYMATRLLTGPDGQAVSSKTVENIHDIDSQPLFGTPAWQGQTAWFVSYHGRIQGFDFSGDVGKALPGAFELGTAEGAAPEWRPGGWQVIATDTAGKLYVLMSPNGREGSHKDGGTEVWVADPATKTRVTRIALRGVATAIGLTKEAKPQLIVARADGEIDVHDAASGAFVRSLGKAGGDNPILITAP
ncbi:MAG: hypothetical protein B7Y70_09085 [Rhizobiales bacterium 35-68-8]|nr:MAG: hypothetical protein B7Y70_09085 [Rhizobiales bacterium 35-68-8]